MGYTKVLDLIPCVKIIAMITTIILAHTELSGGTQKNFNDKYNSIFFYLLFFIIICALGCQ